MKVKIANGYADVVVGEKKLIVCFCNGSYDLLVHTYCSKTLMVAKVCENVKRIGTINKYAQQYGVEFVA